MAVTAGNGIIAVTVDPKQLKEIEQLLADIPNGLPRAVNSAINKTLTTGRSRIVKRLAKILNLKAGRATNPEPGTVSAFVGVKRSTFATLSGAIKLTRKPIPLIKFAPQPAAPITGAALQQIRGVSVQTRKGGGRELLPHTFVARMKSGHIGIFERIGRGSARTKRLPIVERMGPTPLGVFENAPGVSQQVLAEIGETFQKNLSSQLQWVLSTGKPKAEGDDEGDED